MGVHVIGLTTAVTLAEPRHWVLVRTAEQPALTTTTSLNTSAQHVRVLDGERHEIPLGLRETFPVPWSYSAF